jgi:Carboxypeptidase regulatory-like domain/TonB dependent receptor-like, beta-barrel
LAKASAACILLVLMSRRNLILLLLTALILAAGIVAADTLTGEIHGGVLDTQTKLVLPDVAVTLSNTDKEWQRPGTTDTDGNYVFLQLEPGRYALTFRREGYIASTKTDIQVRLNQPKVVLPPVELRREVATPTREITVATPEGSKIAVIDLTAPIPTQAVLTYVNERGYTSLTSLLDSALRWNYDESVLSALPLRGGRTFDQLALFSPGVLRVPFTGGEGPAVGIGVGTAGQFAANGLRGRSNNFTVDGSDNNDEDIGVRRQGFIELAPQSVESIQEFQVVTAGFPAEFGRNAGAMVNAVSRSGQNSHHGTAYGMLNNDALNSANFFDRPFSDRINSGINNGGAFSASDQRFNQIGGTAGGPILPGRMYYFSSIERQHTEGNVMRHFVVPTPQERGLRVSRQAGGFIPINQLGQFFDDIGTTYSNEAGKGVLGLYPLPNNPSGPFQDHTYSAVKRAEGTGNGVSGKIDWYAAERHTFMARYNFTNDNSTLPFTGGAINSSLATHTRTQNLSLFYNATLPGFASALRLSYGRTHLGFPPEGGSPLLFGSAPSSLLPSSFAQTIQTPYGKFGPFGSTGPIGQLSVLPYDTIGIDVFNFPQGRVDNTFQIAEALTFTRKSHQIRGGVDFRRVQLNSFADRNSRPQLVFGYGEIDSDCTEPFGCPYATGDGLLHGTDLASLGAPSGFLQAISTQPSPDSSIGLRMGQADFFLQDNWKVNARLAVNVGVRYELQTVTKEAHRKIENTFSITPAQFGKLAATGTYAAAIQAGNDRFDAAVLGLQSFLAGRDTIYDPQHDNIAPRIGVAWNPRGDGQLAIRAGYSISYDANLGAVTSQSRNVFPTFVPVNLDLNFLQPTDSSNRGLFLNSPSVLTFLPTGVPLLKPGTLNTYNLTGNAFATGLGILFGQAPESPSADLNSNGLAFTLPEKNLRAAHADEWTVSLEKTLNRDTIAALTYVGTRGLNLPRFSTPNAGRLSTPLLLASAVRPLTLLDYPPSNDPLSNSRPQPGLGSYSVFEDSADSNYHALQLSVERRLRRGLQFRGNWTWGHVVDQVSDPFDGRSFTALPQNLNQPASERGSANFDARHRVAGYAVWDIPAMSSHRAFRDWRIASTTEFQTGPPFTVNTAIDRNLDGNLTDRLNRTDGFILSPHDPAPVQIKTGVNSLDLIAPPRRNGIVGRNTFRADGLATVDLAVSRRMALTDTRTLDFRIEAFNLFNSVNFGIPVRTLESPGFGRTYDLTVDPRAVRFYAKISF